MAHHVPDTDEETYVGMGWNFVSESNVAIPPGTTTSPIAQTATHDTETVSERTPSLTDEDTSPNTRASGTDVAFSNDGSDAITRSVAACAVPRQAIDDSKLEVVYEISRCVREVALKKVKMVALQFPDEMLPDATRVSEELT